MPTTTDPHIPASACLGALRDARCDRVVTVPDWVQLAMHVRLEAGEPGLPMVDGCAEHRAVTLAAGSTIGEKAADLIRRDRGG